MIKRIVKDKDGNILEDKEIFIKEELADDNSKDSKEERKPRKNNKKY